MSPPAHDIPDVLIGAPKLFLGRLQVSRQDLFAGRAARVR